jgi:tryptophan 2,3-dioxygenase
MSTTGEVFLGVIAVAVAIMALIQIGAIMAAVRLAQRVDRITTQLEQEFKPLLGNLTAMSHEAAKATARAAVSVERMDRTFEEVLGRVDQTVAAAHHIINGPARNGLAVVAGVKAAMGAFTTLREASRRRSAVRSTVPEDEESLFIG